MTLLSPFHKDFQQLQWVLVIAENVVVGWYEVFRVQHNSLWVGLHDTAMKGEETCVQAVYLLCNGSYEAAAHQRFILLLLSTLKP